MKASLPISVRPYGRRISVNCPQLQKALTPMVLRLSGRVIFFRLLQCMNALDSIAVTFSGIETLTTSLPEKALAPMILTG